ncbi:amino acid ABC transporter permease [Subtercola boreus]|uniref:amino acid ABC transporter permease n=1 Tax=Subtercola boreus TaxID=120213 RepID=UPI001167724C|nr:amino acid ABC transporter permease [Subtercola boreus]TQL55516.1 polar amino acid transport system permease protein [Subtercola boreus]
MTTTQTRPPATRPVYRVVPRRSVFPWILAAVLLVIVVGVIGALATNPALNWATTLQYLFSERILRGVWITIQLSVLAMLFGSALGVVVGLLRMSKNRMLRTIASVYIMIFRSVPALLQLLLWGNIGLVVRNISMGIPFTDVQFFSVTTNSLIAPFTAAVIGLALLEAAFVAEIVRGGVASIDRGQFEASSALGMPPGYTMRRIVLPQAMRVIVPPLGNQFINLIKGTSLVSVIAGGDVLTEALNISASNYRVIEMLAVATFWYLILVAVASIGQSFLERRLAKGAH